MTSSTTKASAAYVLELCSQIAHCTETSGEITRTFLSPPAREVHSLLRAEMKELGMQVRIDSAGNLRGFLPSSPPGAPILLMGSHLDTVPNAGAYDGILGVTLPLALLHSLNTNGLPFAIELIAFSEEEGIRFKLPFIGSRALIGDLGPADLARQDASGITIAEAIRTFGLDPDHLSDAAITPGTFAFLEVHIEQGPVLDSLDLPLGIVDTIVGQSRFQLTFSGQANHAGTTPMPLRRDALAAAARFVTFVEQTARATDGLVATVGTLQVSPGAANVVPGSATLSLDVRHSSDQIRESTSSVLLAFADQVAAERGLTVSSVQTSQQAAVLMDANLLSMLTAAAHTAGSRPHLMPSGAGHDAMIVARRVPAAMLFLRTPAGLSHHPDEAVSESDIQTAIDLLRSLLIELKPI